MWRNRWIAGIACLGNYTGGDQSRRVVPGETRDVEGVESTRAAVGGERAGYRQRATRRRSGLFFEPVCMRDPLFQSSLLAAAVYSAHPTCPCHLDIRIHPHISSRRLVRTSSSPLPCIASNTRLPASNVVAAQINQTDHAHLHAHLHAASTLLHLLAVRITMSHARPFLCCCSQASADVAETRMLRPHPHLPPTLLCHMPMQVTFWSLPYCPFDLTGIPSRSRRSSRCER